MARDPMADGRSPTAAGRSLALVQFLVLAGLVEALIAAGTAGRVVGGRLLVACLRAAVRAFGRSVVDGAMDDAIEEVRLAQRREVLAANRSRLVAGPLRRAVERGSRGWSPPAFRDRRTRARGGAGA